MAKKTASFLGANTPAGFVSFFDELYNPYKNVDAYIIKGGPGTGKSTFMKKIAAEFEKRGFDTELIYCSSDPSSLDGLIVPQKSFCICDGTAPHVMEPRFPGVAESIINLGEFWNKEILKKHADEIRRLFFENSLFHRRSGKYLAAAGHIDEQIRKIAFPYIRQEKIESYCQRFIHRELKSKSTVQPGERKRRFLSAITPKGNIILADTITALCPRIIGIDDSVGAVAPLITTAIGQGAVKNGLDIISCHCPIKPDECEHLLVPQKGIAVIRANGAAGEIACDRVIHIGRFMHEGFSKNKSVLKFNAKIKHELINESISCLKKAKATHDELEKIYIDAMDFEKLNEYCNSFTEKLFS